METRSPKRKKLSIMNEDRISDLPDPIIHNILILLPIKSSAQTMILSRRWKDVFFSIPALDFTTINPLSNNLEDPFVYVKDYLQDKKRKRMLDCWNCQNADLDLINNLLSLRDKNSSITTIKLRGSLTFKTLHKLTKYAAKYNTQELDMDIKTRDRFDLPGSIVDCESLRILKLRSESPGFSITTSHMQGIRFKYLHTMALSQIEFPDDDDSTLIDLFTDSSFPCLKKLLLDSCVHLTELNVACSGLEDLIITRCFQLHKLDIVGTKLERLKVSLCFSYLNIINNRVRINAPAIKFVEWVYNILTHSTLLEKATLLEEVILNFSLIGFSDAVKGDKARSLLDMVKAFSHAKFLTFQPHCMEMLSRHDMQNILEAQEFVNLRKLEIQTEFDRFAVYDNLPAITILLKKSYYVHTLIFRTMNIVQIEKTMFHERLDEYEKYLEGQDLEMNSLFNHLKTVKFIGFLEDVDMDVCLAKFFMKNGRALEDMVLCLGPLENGGKLARHKNITSLMMEDSWASPKVKIVFQ